MADSALAKSQGQDDQAKAAGALAATQKRMAERIQQYLPATIDRNRFMSFAIGVMRDPALAECTQESVAFALAECAKLGLFPDKNLGHVWLVPFNNRVKVGNQWQSQKEVTLIPGYKGYMELARRSGKITDVYVEIVCERDTWEPPYYDSQGIQFRYQAAPTNSDELNGRWCLIPTDDDRNGVLEFRTFPEIAKIKQENEKAKKKDWRSPQVIITDLPRGRGKPQCVFVVAPLKDGGSPRPEVLSMQEIIDLWARSKAQFNGPWVTDFAPMMKKAAIRRASKLWPMTTELAKFGEFDDRSDGYEREQQGIARRAGGSGSGGQRGAVLDLNELHDGRHTLPPTQAAPEPEPEPESSAGADETPNAAGDAGDTDGAAGTDAGAPAEQAEAKPKQSSAAQKASFLNAVEPDGRWESLVLFISDAGDLGMEDAEAKATEWLKGRKQSKLAVKSDKAWKDIAKDVAGVDWTK